MSRLSVPEAAARLNVSPARIRQRIDGGSLVAQKIGGRWLVDLAASQAAPSPVGRPVAPSSVWWSLAVAQAAGSANGVPELQGLLVAKAGQPSRSSQNRAVQRLAAAVASPDHAALLAWLGHRASRRLFVAAPRDLDHLRADQRLAISGVSHPASGMEDPRVVEGYVESAEVESVVADHWLERPGVDDRPNVVLHISPVRPPAVGDVLLAADLAEHSGPREVARAHEMLDYWLDDLLLPDRAGDPLA